MLAPKAAAIAPGASSPGAKLAADTMLRGGGTCGRFRNAAMRFAISVEIRCRDRATEGGGRKRTRQSVWKRAIPFSQQHAHTRRSRIDHSHVESPVSVEVPEGNCRRTSTQRKRRRQESAIAF